LISKIKKNEDPIQASFATIALFNIANICFQSNSQKRVSIKAPQTNALIAATAYCDSLPESIVRDPMKILDDGAKTGSSLVKTYFLKSALDFAEDYKKNGTKESVQYANELLKKAQQYGSEAVQDGIQEASLLMSRAHIEGQFEKSNQTIGVAYLLSLSEKSPSKELTTYASKLNTKLTILEKNIAKELASGCAQKNNDILNSPF
jgi:hypothetical protein